MTIKQEMISGIFWTAVQKYSGLVVQLIVTAILARLLSPEDFGIVAVATVLIAFFSLFTDMGIGPAIIQKQELTDEDLNSIFSFTVWGEVTFSVHAVRRMMPAPNAICLIICFIVVYLNNK